MGCGQLKSKNEENYEQYLVPADYKLPEVYKADGFVMPYADSPLDEEQVGEQVYLDILNQAKSYVHIITPYLILDDGMKNAMAYAAKRGIDVKIIMPHIPDKKYAYLLARTYYPELIASGVKIYSMSLVLPMQRSLSVMMKRQQWEASTWISEVYICILNVEPIYTETVQLQMWRRILKIHWKNVFLLR